MTIEDIIKANGGTVTKQSGESADTGTKSTSRISEIIAANKEAADKQLAMRSTPKAHGGASSKFGVDAKRDDGAVKIHALGAGETKPTTSRVGKTINAGVQGTMSNFTNFWGWLKESDAAAKARDEADKEYTERQNKQLAETKGEKATAKTEIQQKQKYAENHAKQKDNWSKDYEKADKLSAMSEKNVAEAKEGLGKVGQALVDIGVVGTQMLGDAVLNIIPGGGTASMIARVAGGAAQQARLEGKDIGQQSLSAIKSGGIAWLTEKMFGAFGKLYGKGAADDVVEAVVRRIGKTNAGKNFLRLGLNALGEGTEEITEDLLNAAADRALKLGDGELDLGEVLYDGFLGFALGGLGAGTQMLNGNYRIKNEMQQRANAQKVLAKTVAENAADPETVRTAEAMVQKLNGGEMLTTAEIETLAGALEASTNAEETAEAVQQGEVAPDEKKPLTPVEAITRVAQGKAGNENEQLNIDNTANLNYTENINNDEQGGVPNDSYRVDRGMVEGVSERQTIGEGSAGEGRDGRGDQELSRRDLIQGVKRVLNDSGVVAAELKDYSADSAAFSNALSVARTMDQQNGWAVSPQDANKLQGKRLLMDANGTIGLAITSDGDIEAVFKNKALNKTRHALDGVMPQALAASGTKLDCYGENLVKAYERYGFVPVARVEFNPKYANEGWTPDKGTPYIYFMMHNGDSAETVAANIGKYPQSTAEQRKALPTFGKEEYDAAYAYRDELLEQQQSDLPEGMGAASAEFTGEMSPAEQWVAEAQGKGDNAVHDVSAEATANLARQQHRAPQDVPKYDKDGRLTRAGVEAIINSGFTDNAFAQRMLEETFKGAASYSQFSDKMALRKAKADIKKQGYAETVAKYLSDSFNGKVSKQSTVTGLVLLDNAIAAKDYELAVKLTVALAEDGTNSAQALQARRLLNKMTPSGKLYAVTQVADRVAAAQRKRIGEAKIDREAGKIENATEEVKQAIVENFKARAQRQSNKTVEGNQAGEPFWFEYETEVGKAIADVIKNRVAPKPKKQQPFIKTVIRNLTAFANQLTPKAMAKPKMTATERIADYLANKEFYDNAWANAQEELMQRYEGDEAMLDALGEFTSSLTTMTTPTGTQTMIKALAESAFDQYLDAKTLAIQNSLNIDGAANAIAQRLVSEIERISGIKVDEETALSIRLAADDYVQGAIAEADPNALVSAQIKDVLRNLDVKLAELATSSRVDKAAVGTAVIDTLTKRWGFSEADALNVAEVVQSQFTDMVTETMERKLKQIYGEKKEREVKSMTQLFAESVNLGAFDSGEYAQKAAERFFGADIQIDPELAREYVEALEDGTDEDIANALEALQQNIAGQIPVSWVDKLNAWRYLAMLGNPRTHIRNILGNTFFSIPVLAKNVVSTGIETGVDKLSKNGIQRTKAVLNPLTNKQDRALLAIAMADYANASEQILAGGKYDDIFSGVSDKQTIFQFKPLEAVRKFNSKALDKEDVWFAQPHYATALAGYLKANGISAVEFTNGSMSEAAMNEARNYAVKEAQKATFRDINAFSKMVSKLGKSDNKVVNAATSAILPFKKTPANILVRGVEYSPIGLAKGLLDIRNIKTPNNPNGTKTAAEVIDELAAGLTGTGLVALGALLVRSGALTGGGGDDDKENKFQSLQGKQNYALVLPDGTTVTLDWLAPEVLPVFVGVELYNSLSGNGNSWENILAAISTIPQPMLDMSLLQSVNDLIDNVAYAKEGKGIYKIIAGMATSLLSQFVPTVLGQIERTAETERQQTFIDRSENAPSSAVQSFWARLNDKNPFYDYNKIPYIDAWGRTEETGTFAERFANNFFNPAYVKEASGTPIDSELERLYKLGNTSVYPAKPGTDVKINGEYLSAEEYVEYAKKRGSESLENVRELINSSAYKNMSDADKADAIKAAYDYADDIAKQYVRRGAKISSWVEKATASGNPSQYIADTIIMRAADTDGNGSFSNAEKVRGLIDGGYSGGKLVEKVREYMTTDNGNCKFGDMLERAQSVKVPDTVTLNVYEFHNKANSKDASGNTVPGLKKERVQQYIDSLNSLTAEQKDALYYSLYKK